MRISDWSSDVGSSDRQNPRPRRAPPAGCRGGRCPSAAAPLRPAARSSVERRQSSGLEAVRKQDQGNGSGALFRQVNPTPLLAQRSPPLERSEEHTSELQSLMRISYAVFCLKKKKTEYKVKSQKYDKREQRTNES